jgi:hypothetical protein
VVGRGVEVGGARRQVGGRGQRAGHRRPVVGDPPHGVGVERRVPLLGGDPEASGPLQEDHCADDHAEQDSPADDEVLPSRPPRRLQGVVVGRRVGRARPHPAPQAHRPTQHQCDASGPERERQQRPAHTQGVQHGAAGGDQAEGDGRREGRQRPAAEAERGGDEEARHEHEDRDDDEHGIPC